MNRLHDAHAEGKTGRDIHNILDAPGDATVRHFADEEAYVETLDYAKLRIHELIHEDLLKRFGAFSEEIHAKNGVVREGVFLFLKHWLTAHIKGIDMEYGKASPLASHTDRRTA